MGRGDAAKLSSPFEKGRGEKRARKSFVEYQIAVLWFGFRGSQV